MNRSILIVICDFLLLSLLTFSTDINRMANDDTQRSAKVDVVTNDVVEPGKDLATLMKQALADERKGRQELEKQLAASHGQQEQLTRAQQEQLARAQQENARLQQESAGLRERYTMAETNIEGLSHQLQNVSAEAQLSQQKLAIAENQTQKQNDLAAALKQQLDQLARSNQLAMAAESQLAGRLQISETERQAALDRAGLMQQEVQATWVENARLADGLKSLATNSSQLTQEIRENRALAPNMIFSEFVTNRVHTSIAASRSGFLGMDVNKNKNAETILVTDGKNTFAICHVDATPLSLWDPGTDWDDLTGMLSGLANEIPVRSMSFHKDEPRVVMFPLSSEEAKRLGCKVYRMASDPYRFQDAVLIGADNGYYGQCDFQIDMNTPQYVRLDRNLLKGLFGKFNPSRGDVVLSRTGEFLGIMVNSTYCYVMNDFAAATSLAFGSNVRSEHTGDTLAHLYDQVFQMPQQLQ